MGFSKKRSGKIKKSRMCVSNVDTYVGNVQNMRYTQDKPYLENMHSMQIMQNFEDKKKYEN